MNTNKGGLGPFAPSQNLPFPAHAHLTAYELLAFLPNSLRCADVVYRFISNGATRRAIWVIVNTARDLQKEWHANCCGSTMYKTMQNAGYEDWTIKKHGRWHDVREEVWDETKINVAGFRTPHQSDGHRLPAAGILFRALGLHVRRMPEGDDALDLTRMVQYCEQHPDVEWMYPRDYEQLLNLLGGPAPIHSTHLDRAAFGRWERAMPPAPRIWSDEEISSIRDVLEAMTKPRRVSARDMELEDSRKTTPETGKGQRVRERPRKHMKLDRSDREDAKQDKKVEMAQIRQYVRAPAEHVPPPNEAVPPSASAIEMAFAAEQNVGEVNPYSAYAFGGPRQRSPYRMLHDIDQPDPSDISGWSENLRWALEQRACFRHSVQTEVWNESPAHMEAIAQTRLKQVWASDELLEQLPSIEDEWPGLDLVQKPDGIWGVLGNAQS